MPSGGKLTDYEKGKIIALRSSRISIRKIALQLKISKTVVHNYIKLGEKYRSKDPHWRKKMTSDRTRRRILRAASRGISSVKKIKEDLQVSASEDII